MALTDFFAGEIASELLKMLMTITRKSWLCRASAKQLITYIHELLPTIEEIKSSGVELPASRQSQLNRLSEMLRSGVDLSHEVLSSSRWNLYKKLQLAKKMEKLEKSVSRFVQGPMQAHILADVHHTRFEMAERFDMVEASHRRLEQYFATIKIYGAFSFMCACACVLPSMFLIFSLRLGLNGVGVCNWQCPFHWSFCLSSSSALNYLKSTR